MKPFNYHPCSICSTPVRHWEKYPRAVCHSCHDKASDAQGRKLSFSNIDMSGGFRAVIAETQEEYLSHICFIDNVQCWVDEARFGGIVIQSVEGKTTLEID